MPPAFPPNASADAGWTGADRDRSRSQAHLESQARRIQALVEREVALLGGDSTRLILGGSSQGGTVALHAAIGYGRPLGALLCLRSCLVETVTVPRDRRSAACRTPVFVFACAEDSVYALPLQRRGYGKLAAAGYQVEWHVEPDLVHWDDSRNELRCAAAWIHRVWAGGPRALRRSGSERGGLLMEPCRAISPETC